MEVHQHICCLDLPLGELGDDPKLHAQRLVSLKWVAVCVCTVLVDPPSQPSNVIYSLFKFTYNYVSVFIFKINHVS